VTFHDKLRLHEYYIQSSVHAHGKHQSMAMHAYEAQLATKCSVVLVIRQTFREDVLSGVSKMNLMT
jgi:hypothetical protein